MIFEQLIQKPSPYFTDKVIVQKLIIIHWTGGDLRGTIPWLLKKKFSYHFLVDANAKDIYQLVDSDKKCWGAGESISKYGKWCNNHSIQIALEGPPSKLGLDEWPETQLLITAQLCKEIIKFHPTIEAITDHSTVSPGRKPDVKQGIAEDTFPWDKFVILTGIKNYSHEEDI